MTKPLIFGNPEPGIQYAERRAAYVVITTTDNRIAMVKPKQKYFLPGGGSLPDETAEETAIREAREELSKNINLTGKIAEVIQYFYSPADERHYKMFAIFFSGEFIDLMEMKTGENELHWLTTDEIENGCFHECHAWAARQVQ